MAHRESTPAGDVGKIDPARRGRPRIVFLHFSAPPVVGGVEAVIAEQQRLFEAAGFPTLIVAGREAEGGSQDIGDIALVPEIDSESPTYLQLSDALLQAQVPAQFSSLQAQIEQRLTELLKPSDVVIAHNVMTTHFNLALVAAVHRLVADGKFPALVVWCHDVSRYVNPERDVTQLHGGPWDLLRTRLPGASYVAVSTARQRTLAHILGCDAQDIRVIPNGVDPVRLLALSPMGKDLVDAYDLESADLIVLMPIRITKIKNIEYALWVVKALKVKGQTVRLIVTGPPDPHVADIPEYFHELVELRDQLGLRAEAHFVYEGTEQHQSPLIVDEETVAELYRLADIILMPSLREGFGMPVFEGSMVDRPVFATPIPATEEIDDFQYLIGRDERAESLADRIAVWAEHDAAHRLRAAVRQEYTWQRIFRRKILPLISSVSSSEVRS